jgi:hypothetical protein
VARDGDLDDLETAGRRRRAQGRHVTEVRWVKGAPEEP